MSNKLFKLMEQYKVKVELIPKRTEGKTTGRRGWYARYVWEAVRYADDKFFECEWEGYVTQRGCINNMVRVLS